MSDDRTGSSAGNAFARLGSCEDGRSRISSTRPPCLYHFREAPMKSPRQVMLPGLAGLLLCMGTFVPILQADSPKPPALPDSDPSKISASDKPPANVAELRAQQA